MPAFSDLYAPHPMATDQKPLPGGQTDPWKVKWVETPYGLGHVENFDLTRHLFTIVTAWGARLTIHQTKVRMLPGPPTHFLSAEDQVLVNRSSTGNSERKRQLDDEAEVYPAKRMFGHGTDSGDAMMV